MRGRGCGITGRKQQESLQRLKKEAELCTQGDFLSIEGELHRSCDTIWNSFYT